MELVPVQSDQAWDDLLEAQPGRSLYHTTAWLRFQAEQFGFDLRRLVIRDESGPVGIFPLFLVRRAIFRIASSPRGLDYLNLGPLVAPELLGSTLDCYERWARENRVDFTSIAFMREIDGELARQRGYRCQRHLLALTDLRKGEDAVFGACTKPCQRLIRKAERLGVTIVEGSLDPYLDRYLEWSARIYAKSGIKSPLNKAALSAMLAALGQSGRLLSLRAQVGDEVIGMYVVGHYGKTAYSLDIVADYDKSRFSASNLMTWHALRWSCRQGLEMFDFGGARISSIARFKNSFGATLVPYTNITRARGPLARSATWLKEAMANRIRGATSRGPRKAEHDRQSQRPDMENGIRLSRHGPA